MYEELLVKTEELDKTDKIKNLVIILENLNQKNMSLLPNPCWTILL